MTNVSQRTLIFLAITGGLLSALCPGAVAQTVDSTARDAWDGPAFERLQRDAPQAVEKLLQGEAALQAQDASHAVQLLTEGSALAPGNALMSRRLCEALVLSGDHQRSVPACTAAERSAASPAGQRALVGALVATPELDQRGLGIAATAAAKAERTKGYEVWGHSAWCALADRVQNEVLMKKCVAGLMAHPDHPEARRALKVYGRTTLVPFWAGWSLLGLGGLLTAGHGLLRALSSRRAKQVKTVVTAALLAAAGLAVNPSTADARETDPNAPLGTMEVNPDDPAGSLPPHEVRNQRPLDFAYLLMDLSDTAERALKDRDFDKAAKYFGAIAEAVPDRAIGYAKQCDALALGGKRKEAIAACRKALGLEGVRLQDYLLFANLVSIQPAQLTEQDVQDVTEIVRHLQAENAPAVVVAQIQCSLGARVRHVELLTQCTDVLAKVQPTDRATLTYQWALAMAKEDHAEARTVIEHARSAVMNPGGIEAMAEATDAVDQRPRRLATLIVAALLAMAGLAWYLLRFARRKPATSTATA